VQNSPGQFKQVVVLGLHFQLPHGVQLNAATNVTPLGQIRYTAYATTYASRGVGSDSPGATFSGKFFSNVVRGTVVNPQDEPIAGAALLIGGELAVTDSEGNFQVRRKKAGTVNLEVAFDEFTTPGSYVVVSAPATVLAAREDGAQDYKIILRRVPYVSSTAGPSNRVPTPEEQTAPPDVY
jgi:hypothetical protein